MGIPLRDVIYDIGGGIDRQQKIQGCPDRRPVRRLHPRIRSSTRRWIIESLDKAGAIMGSGGMVVMDETDCMVDMAKFFLQFTQDESCGKCVPCRIGTKRFSTS